MYVQSGESEEEEVMDEGSNDYVPLFGFSDRPLIRM